jgi:CDP-glycerol glycerophosphotransferase
MLKGIVKEPFKFIYRGILLPALGRLFIVPLTFLVPKKKNLVILIGRDGGNFSDNVKHLFIYLDKKRNEAGIEFFFLTGKKDVYEGLIETYANVLFYPRMKAIWKLLRARVMVADNEAWVNNYKFHFSFRCSTVQIWHGVGLKKVGFNSKRNIHALKHPLIKLYYWAKGKFHTYDLVISTSEFFTENGYVTGLRRKNVLEAGYPRNDVFFHDPGDSFTLSMGIDEDAYRKIKKFKQEGYKAVIYAPTYRDAGADAVTEKKIDLSKLDAFLKETKSVFVFKFHSWGMVKDPVIREQLNNSENIIVYDNSKDIYPLLNMFDLMVSDYSSIYMDYLLLNRPVLFFPYDYDRFVEQDREFYCDYEFLTPGPKCMTQEELESEIKNHLVDGSDGFGDKREKLLDLTFKYKDGNASQRILEYIRTHFVNTDKKKEM